MDDAFQVQRRAQDYQGWRVEGERGSLPNTSSWKIVNIHFTFILQINQAPSFICLAPLPTMLSEAASLSSMFIFHQSLLPCPRVARQDRQRVSAPLLDTFFHLMPHPHRRYTLSSDRCFLSFLLCLIEQRLQIQMPTAARKATLLRKSGKGSQRTGMMPHKRKWLLPSSC